MEIMDFPGNFAFLEKLKLYQNYLKKGAKIEKTRNRYWLYGKALLYWYYSEDNIHIGKPLSAQFLITNKIISHQIIAIAKKISHNEENLQWIEENALNQFEIMHVIGNLYVMGFIKEVSRYSEFDIKKERITEDFLHTPKEFFISGRGFLLGELLYEIYSPHFIERHLILSQLHWATRIFYVLLIILIVTAILVFIYNLQVTGILTYFQQLGHEKNFFRFFGIH